LVSGSIKVSLRKTPDRSFVLKPKEKIIYIASEDGVSLNGGEKKKIKAPDSTSFPEKSKDQKVEVTHLNNILSPSGDSIVAETAWINNKLVFDGEKFSALAKRMNRWYDVQLNILDENVADYRFTGIFDGETLEQALKELQMIRPFNFEINKDSITISE